MPLPAIPSSLFNSLSLSHSLCLSEQKIWTVWSRAWSTWLSATTTGTTKSPGTSGPDPLGLRLAQPPPFGPFAFHLFTVELRSVSGAKMRRWFPGSRIRTKTAVPVNPVIELIVILRTRGIDRFGFDSLWIGWIRFFRFECGNEMNWKCGFAGKEWIGGWGVGGRGFETFEFELAPKGDIFRDLFWSVLLYFDWLDLC